MYQNLIAIYSKWFFWIFFTWFFCWFYPYVLFIDMAGSSDISFKGNPLRMIQTKFGLNWPSGFRGENFWKSLQTDDGCQVMAIAHTGELKMNVSVICTHILMEFFFNETCIVLLCNYFRFWHKRGPKGEFLINQRGCMDRCTYMGKSLCT